MSPRWPGWSGTVTGMSVFRLQPGPGDPDTHQTAKDLVCFTAVGLNSLLFTFCSVLPGEKSWSLIKRQKYEEMNSLLFFSSEVLSISCSFSTKVKWKSTKKKKTTIKIVSPSLDRNDNYVISKNGHSAEHHKHSSFLCLPYFVTVIFIALFLATVF